MRDTSRCGFVIGLALAIAFAIVFTGCGGDNEAPQDEEGGNPQSEDAQQNDNDNGNGTDEESEVQEPDYPEGSLGDLMRRMESGRSEVTEEDVENITGYGVIRFPDSVLVADQSLHQEHPDGTEIWLLEFGSDTSVHVVADWYRENLEEEDIQEETIELDDGRVVYGFEYRSQDETWMKRITVGGHPAERKTIITVNLTRRMIQTEEEEESGEEEADVE